MPWRAMSGPNYAISSVTQWLESRRDRRADQGAAANPTAELRASGYTDKIAQERRTRQT
jgi:hypothetical protein